MLRSIYQRSAWGTSKWLGPGTLHIQGSCQPWARWSVFIGGWRKGTDYKPAMCNCIWFIKRTRKWSSTRSREEGTYFREPRWQRMNSPMGFRGMQKVPESWVCHLLAVRPDPKSLHAVLSPNYDNISSTELLHVVSKRTFMLHLEFYRVLMKCEPLP